MNIKTKFNINDLIQHKFSKASKDASSFYEVKEVHTITCYGGSQVFYHCRPLALIYKDTSFLSIKEKIKSKTEVIDVHHGVTKAGPVQYIVIREDEVKACSKEISKHIK